jgi:hypothetical protein
MPFLININAQLPTEPHILLCLFLCKILFWASMATQKLTEYEIKRLENIRRNDEMLATLQLHAKASLLSNATKRSR